MMEVSLSDDGADPGKRLIYLDAMRIFATFTVILLHVSAEHWLEAPVNSYAWQVFNIYNSLVRFNVQLFVSISGALFLDKAYQTGVRKLYTKSILRLLTAYVGWSFIYAIYTCLDSGFQGSFRQTAVYLIKTAIDSYYHLWFVPMLIGVYMMIPILRPITQHRDCRKICEYFLLLFLLFGILKPSVLAFPLPHKEILTKLADTVNVTAAAGWLGYLILGYYLKEYPMRRLCRWVIYGAAVAGYLFTAWASSYLSLKTGQATSFFTFSFSLSSFLSTAACFIFFKYEVAKFRPGERLVKILSSMSKRMFGVYLIHAMVLRVFLDWGLSALSFNAALAAPLVALLAFVVSYGLTALIARLPLLNKYLI